jgi:ubiquinone/menaquinone biosynthesis C-methylase UbiE
MATVLHEIADPSTLLKEIGRILKPGGTLAVIEFHKRATPMGPPVSHRLGRDEVRVLLDGMPFSVREDMDLGENFYCLTFTRAPGN